jgi:mRNA interferase MazF
MLWSMISEPAPEQVAGEVEAQSWQAAGLLKPSVLKPALTTIEPALILKRLGQQTLLSQARLRQAIAQILG